MAEKIGTYSNHRNWFFFTLLYLIIDYGRPQDILPIAFLKPGMITILVLVGFLLFNGNLKDTRSMQTKLIWLFVVLLAAYIPFARNNYYAFLATEGMLLYIPFILSIVICIDTIGRLKKLIFIMVLLMIFQSGYSLLHHGLGTGSYFGDENDLSLYINMWLPFCFFLFSNETRKYGKNIYGIGLIIGVIAVVFSFSRGGFVGLVCTAIIIWLYSAKKLSALIIISLIGILLYSYAGDSYWKRINTTTNTEEGTAKTRIESWKSGWNMFVDNPLGVGGNNFIVRFPEYQTDYFHRGMWGRAAHSLWFTLLPELGVFGVIIFILLLYHNLKDIFFLKRIRDVANDDLKYFHALSAAFIASIAGYFSSATFLSVLYYPHYWYLTGILVATVKVGKMAVKANEIANSDRMQ